jgi:hypothetical protein
MSCGAREGPWWSDNRRTPPISRARGAKCSGSYRYSPPERALWQHRLGPSSRRLSFQLRLGEGDVIVPKSYRPLRNAAVLRHIGLIGDRTSEVDRDSRSHDVVIAAAWPKSAVATVAVAGAILVIEWIHEVSPVRDICATT